MQPLATDEEQVAFWRRHTRLGVALSVLIPAIVALRTMLLSAPSHRVGELAVGGATAVLTPFVLLLPIERMVRHRFGRLFYDAWEVIGVCLVATFAVLDGGAKSPYVMFFFVLLAHAALAYPPTGMVIAGLGNIVGYVVVCLLAGGTTGTDLIADVLVLALATGTCAFASYNHVRTYRRTAAYARQIAVLAARDGLTGCLNHRTFHERLLAEALVADRDRPLSLLIVDVDDFKRVNDTFGHQAGDAVLRTVGLTLADLCRADDTTGRLGGDEFAILLPSTTIADARLVAERVCHQVRQRAAAHAVSVSIGVAVTTSRSDAAGLLTAADRAVYRAKRAGRDRVATPDDGQTAAHALQH